SVFLAITSILLVLLVFQFSVRPSGRFIPQPLKQFLAKVSPILNFAMIFLNWRVASWDNLRHPMSKESSRSLLCPARSSRGRAFSMRACSRVLRDGADSTLESVEALDRLCRQHWQPLYYFVRRRGPIGTARSPRRFGLSAIRLEAHPRNFETDLL